MEVFSLEGSQAQPTEFVGTVSQNLIIVKFPWKEWNGSPM